MALSEKELAKLQEDFFSGRNSRAYIPLCQALRRERRYNEALEICQRGLEYDANSLAGRAMLVRLYNDIGRYDEALENARRALERNPEALTVLCQKALSEIRLHRHDDAAETMKILDEKYPFEAEAQAVRAELQELRRRPSRSSNSSEAVPAFIHIRMEDVLKSLLETARGVASVLTAGIVDLDSQKVYVEGREEHISGAENFYTEVTLACSELDSGLVHQGVIELEKAMIVVVRRDRRLVVVAVEPETNFGRLNHRINALLDQHLAWNKRNTADEEQRADTI